MEFNPFTEEDFIEKEPDYLLEPGDVNFTIMHVIEKISKSGNPMLEMKVEAIDCNGKKRDVFDVLVFTDNSKWKIKALLYSIRSEEEAKQILLSGNLCTDDLVGYSGRGVVEIDEYVNSNLITRKKMKFKHYYPLNEAVNNEVSFEDNLDDIQF